MSPEDGSGSVVSGSATSAGTGAPSRPTAMAGTPWSLPSPSSASGDAPGVSSPDQRLTSGAGAADGGVTGGALCLGPELANDEVLLNAVLPDSALPPVPLPFRLLRFSSRPAAMTVTRTSSPSASSMTAPKMMFASTAAELETS